MSQRGKRGNHLHHPRLDVEPQPPPTKRRKGRPPNGGGGGGSSSLVGSSGSNVGAGGSGGGPGPGLVPNFNPAYSVGVSTSCNSTLISSNTTNNINTTANPQIDTDNPPHASSSIGGNAGDEPMCSTSSKAVGLQGGCSSSSAAAWQARSVSDIKMSSIYNRSSTEAPAELYR